MNTEPIDYEARKGLREFQQRRADVPQQSEIRNQQSAKQPQTEKPKQDETPLARGEVQVLINSLVESIVKGFALKGDVDKVTRSIDLAKNELKRDFLSDRNIKKQILEWATECVPPSLRGLDSDPTRKLGDKLKLVSGSPVGSDKAVWDNDPPTIPSGTALLPHLQWDSVAGKWAIALISSGGYDVNWSFSLMSISGFAATFSGGPVIRGTTLVGTLSETPITISATGQIVYVIYTMASGTLSFGVANADNFPLSASGTYVKALQSFTLNATTIVPLLTYHRGVIQIDGCYS